MNKSLLVFSLYFFALGTATASAQTIPTAGMNRTFKCTQDFNKFGIRMTNKDGIIIMTQYDYLKDGRVMRETTGVAGVSFPVDVPNNVPIYRMNFGSEWVSLFKTPHDGWQAATSANGEFGPYYTCE